VLASVTRDFITSYLVAIHASHKRPLCVTFGIIDKGNAWSSIRVTSTASPCCKDVRFDCVVCLKHHSEVGSATKIRGLRRSAAATFSTSGSEISDMYN